MARTKNLSRYGSTQNRRVLDTLSRQRKTVASDKREIPHEIAYLTTDDEGNIVSRNGSFWSWAIGGAWVVVDGEFVEVIQLKANSWTCTRSDDPREPGTWAEKAHAV